MYIWWRSSHRTNFWATSRFAQNWESWNLPLSSSYLEMVIWKIETARFCHCKGSSTRIPTQIAGLVGERSPNWASRPRLNISLCESECEREKEGGDKRTKRKDNTNKQVLTKIVSSSFKQKIRPKIFAFSVCFETLNFCCQHFSFDSFSNFSTMCTKQKIFWKWTNSQ